MIASIAGPFVNTRIAKFEFKANVLSVNRQKWIDTMRDLVASLNSQLLIAAALRQTLEEPTGVVIARDPELSRRVENLLRTVSKIELMLNPLEQDHQQLNVLTKEAIDQLRSPLLEDGVEDRIEVDQAVTSPKSCKESSSRSGRGSNGGVGPGSQKIRRVVFHGIVESIRE